MIAADEKLVGIRYAAADRQDWIQYLVTEVVVSQNTELKVKAEAIHYLLHIVHTG